ncbi:TolB family protein [Paractinoplanes ferrugineus]|nr:PD40 domain-containing protein [Actinoplanes ferrugineus]
MYSKSSLRRAGSAATAVAAGLATVVPIATPAAAAPAFRTERVSVSSAGVQSDDSTLTGDLSADGRYVVFESYASTLVPGDTNGTGDVFLRDRQTNVTTRLSVSPTGAQADGASSEPQISADGRYVTFLSFATNLASDPRPEIGYDIYLLDRQTGALDRVSETADGRPADGDSLGPSISADGRYVAFQTYAGNLIPGVPGGNVLLYDRTTGQLSPVSVNADGTVAPSGGFGPFISANGRYVAFVSYSADLAPGDTNGVGDIYVRDLVAGTTVRASVGDHDQQIDDSRGGQVSNDGRYVTFWSYDDNVVAGDDNDAADVFVRDLVAGTTRVVSAAADGTPANGYSTGTELTPDGRHVVFSSVATDLVTGDTNGTDDVFRKDLRTGATILVSRRTGGVQGNESSSNPTTTPNGKIIAYGSSATNLTAGDTNEQTDLFVTKIG